MLKKLRKTQKLRYELFANIRIESEANLREHWSKKHRRHKKYIQEVNRLWAEIPEPRPNPPAKITLCRIAPREFDYDNLISAMKTIRDLLAGLLIPGLAPGRADGDTRLEWIYEQKKGRPKEYALQIVVESL